MTGQQAERRPPAVLVNGEAQDRLSTLDRGLLYGDGVFETLAVNGAQPRFWLRHMRRLRTGCRRLGIPPPDADLLYAEARRLIPGLQPCVLRIVITRGPGSRGYRAPAGAQPTRILQLWPEPLPDATGADAGMVVRHCRQRLGINPALAGIKHLNRLEQVLARREWDDPSIHEGLLRDPSGNVIEGTMSNLFVLKGACLQTPDLGRCGVAGIMRSVVLDLARQLGVETVVGEILPGDLAAGEELFLTNSLIGIQPVVRLEQCVYSPGSLTRELQARLAALESEGEAWYP